MGGVGVGKGGVEDGVYDRGDALRELPLVPLKIPTASTLAGLVGWVLNFTKGSLGGALDALGGIFMVAVPPETPPIN